MKVRDSRVAHRGLIPSGQILGLIKKNSFTMPHSLSDFISYVPPSGLVCYRVSSCSRSVSNMRPGLGDGFTLSSSFLIPPLLLSFYISFLFPFSHFVCFSFYCISPFCFVCLFSFFCSPLFLSLSSKVLYVVVFVVPCFLISFC
jgi:hypothetical protein